MATVDKLRMFEEQAIRVERVLNSEHIARSAGRVFYLLTRADRSGGISQKEAVAEMALPKDVVSKLVGSLVVAGKLTSIPETSNPRIRRLNTTDSGKDLVRRLNAAVLNTPPPRPRPTDAGAKGESNAIDFDIAESLGSCVSATKGLDARKRRRRT